MSELLLLLLAGGARECRYDRRFPVDSEHLWASLEYLTWMTDFVGVWCLGLSDAPPASPQYSVRADRELMAEWGW